MPSHDHQKGDLMKKKGLLDQIIDFPYLGNEL